MDKSRRSLGLISFTVALSIASQAIVAADARSAPTEQQLIETLRTAPPAEKALACKQLAIYGSKAAVPELAKLLADEQLASSSRIALEAIPDPSVDEALVEAAKTLNGRLLVGTINSIGVRRSADAVEQLMVRLKDGDVEVASAAAVALGRIGGETATNTLRAALGTAPAAVRSAVAEGCILCAERLASAGQREAAAEIYDEVRRAQVPKQRVIEATRGAILARGLKGIPLLIEQLKSPDKALFQIGLSTARELSGPEVGDALAAELASAPPERAALIVTALGDRAGARISPAVLEAAGAGDRQVRLAAIEVVGKLGDASCVRPLLGIAADSDGELAEAAKAALARLPGEDVNPELARRLSTAKDKSLAVLIETIGERRIDASGDLVKAVHHPDQSIRSAALTALGATGGPKDLAVLIAEVIDAKDATDAEVAGRALQTASIRMPDREATAAELAAAMDRAPTETDARLIRILGAMGGPTALKSIAKAVRGGDAELQDVGTRVLGEWMTADAAPHLYEIAASEHRYKTRALRGYLRIARQLDLSNAQRLDMCRKALAIAERDEERALALEAMKRCPSAESIKLATSLVDDAELRQRAVEAAIFIGERIKDTDPAAAASAGQKALEARPPRELAERARALTRVSNGTR
jgi:HEAT repeat protein